LREQGFETPVRISPEFMFLRFKKRKFFGEMKIPQGKVLERVEVFREILDGTC